MGAPYMADLPTIHERVDFWCSEWARWMRSKPADEMELGFPPRVKPWIGGGESQRTADHEQTQYEQIWQYNCATMDKLIGDLSPAQCCAVRNIYAGDCWRFPRENRLELVEDASQLLLIGMNKWGVT